MTDTPRCNEMVGEPPHYIHDHRCDRRARYVVRGPMPLDVRVVCGTHRRTLMQRGYTEAPSTNEGSEG